MNRAKVIQRKILWTLFVTVVISVTATVMFVQSKFFADVLKKTARRYVPRDLKVETDFTELEVKLVPPGVVVKNPTVLFNEGNPAYIPAGTRLDAQSIEVTFQFFQVLLGSINVNAFAIRGATLRLSLDEAFFSPPTPQVRQKQGIGGVSSFLRPEKLFQFDFRSVSLIDSQIDLTLQPSRSTKPIHVEAFAKELTIGRSTSGRLPAYDVAVDFERALVDTALVKHSVSRLQASLELSPRQIDIRNFSAQDSDLSLHANGVVAGNLLDPKNLKTELSVVARGPINKWLEPGIVGQFLKKVPPNLAGDIAVDGKVRGDLLDLENTFDCDLLVEMSKAKVMGWEADKLSTKARYKEKRVSISSFIARQDDGIVKLRDVEFQVDSSNTQLNLYAELTNIDFRKLMGSYLEPVYPLHMKLTGDLDARVSLGTSFSIDGSTRMRVQEFSLDNQKMNVPRPLFVLLAIPDLRVQSQFHIDRDVVEVIQAEATLRNSKLRANGTVGTDGMFDLDVKGDIDASDVGKLAAFDIAGQGKLHWTIKGKSPSVVLSFDADLKKGKYLDLELGDVKGRVIYDDLQEQVILKDLAARQGRSHYVANGTVGVGKKEDVDVAIKIHEGTIPDFAQVFQNLIRRNVPWYPYDLTGQLKGSVKASGKTALSQLSVEGDFELANVDYRHETFRYGKLHAGFRRGGYVAEGVALQKRNGWLYGDLVFGADDSVKYNVRSENFSSTDIDHFGGLGIPYRAPMRINSDGIGTLKNLKSKLEISFGKGIVKSFPVAPTEFKMQTENRRIEAQLDVFSGQFRGKASYALDDGGASSIDIDAPSFDFHPFLIGLNSALADDAEVIARATGLAHVKFATGELSKLTGTIALDAFRLQRSGYYLALEQPLKVEIKKGDYRFENARLIGLGTNVNASGGVASGTIDYRIGGALNFGFLEFPVHEIASSRLIANIDAKIFGRANAPEFQATASVSGGEFRLRALEQPFEDIKMRVNWNDSTIRLPDGTAHFAGGNVKAAGTAELYLTKAPDLDFKIEIDNSKVKVYPVQYARTTGRLTVKGAELPYKVKGSARVGEAVIKENFSLSDSARTLRSSRFLPQKGAGSAGDIQLFEMDIDIGADKGIFVKNDLFDAEVKGELKLLNTVQSPRIIGHASVLQGKLLFKDNFFTVQNGNIRFTNPVGFDPEFDFSGQTDVKGYKVLMVAAGTVSDYKLNFQSQPPLSETDIVNLLTLGVTSSGFQGLSREDRDAYTRDEMYNLLFNQSGINKGLQEKLGVKVRLDQSQIVTPQNVFRARTSGDAGENVAPKVVLQRQIVKNLNASAGTTVGVGDNQERNIDLEYTPPWAPNFSVLGTYEDQRGSQLKQSRTSMGADLKFSVRFK